MSVTPLDQFHPVIKKWFFEKIGIPTEIQAMAWPEISAGKHVLVTAPTGSGKTLTAFLWAIHQILNGNWPCGQIRVLYISPLNALNNDVQRNLINPLVELTPYFNREDIVVPKIRVLTRSGDTPQNERRQMLRHPPEILITTPESLNILLSSKKSRKMLTGIATVILDEIHAVAGSKRGTHLITAVDRLVPLCGEFQRIALSATIRPIKKIADFLGGYTMEGAFHDPVYKKRPVAVVEGKEKKPFTIRVSFPHDAREKMVDKSWWPALIHAFQSIIKSNQSTLFFANSRRMAEKVTRFINEIRDNMLFETETDDLAYSHHGSLSKEIRLEVEQKLKNGELKAIVATNSLELGIDIGDLDQVVLIQTPPSVSSAIQRVGRSGHGVGETSKGALFPTHGRDFLNAAVMARCMIERDIEPAHLVDSPLDVLAQILLSMTGVDEWEIDALYSTIKTSYPYRNLTRTQFELVLDMLSGRYADARIRELNPRLSVDKIDNTVKAKDGALRLVYLAGGTIPDRGYYDLRLQDSKAKIGELDEEFVWERNIGETFAMGAQTWRVQRITHNDLEVVPSGGKPGIIPFWRAEARNREFYFSSKIAEFIEHADVHLEDDDFKHSLQNNYFLDSSAADELIDFLKRQKEVTQTNLPHRHHLLVEHFDDPLNSADSKQVIMHTLWGGKVNRPYALALSAAWEKKYRYPLEVFADDDAILLLLPHDFNAEKLLTLITSENVETLLRSKLETTGLFGATFRENAGRALLLPRMNIKKRMPLWLNRLRSKKLSDAVINYKDFPILLETWRTCLVDVFDLDNLKLVLDEVSDGIVRVSEAWTTSPSPFTLGLIWQQTNKHMYEDDTPVSGKTSSLNDSLIREIVTSAHLRPRIPETLIKSLEKRLKRTAPGYAPKDSDDLLDWVKERRIIPESEWNELLDSIRRDYGTNRSKAVLPIATKLVRINLPNAETTAICGIENLPIILNSFCLSLDTLSPQPVFPKNKDLKKETEANISSYLDSLKNCPQKEEPIDDTNGEVPSTPDFISQWLSYYGPVSAELLQKIFGLDDEKMEELILSLKKEERIVLDQLSIHAESSEICDTNNLEILLRMARRSRQPDFKPLPLDDLPLFLASFQGVTIPGESVDALKDRLEQLFGFSAPVQAWEEHIFPSRIFPYYTAWLDSLMQSSELVWFGCGEKKIGFAFAEDLELFYEFEGKTTIVDEEINDNDSLNSIIPDRRRQYNFFEISGHTGLNSENTSEKLWQLAWQGRVTNDTFAVVRAGISNKFSAFTPKKKKSRGKRGQFNRWKSSRPLLGNWSVMEVKASQKDIMTQEEILKDRVRQLFRRYGIIFREILSREMPLLGWSRVFRTLRLMELSGEIMSGHFFQGIPGLQFITHDAFRFINQPLSEDAIYLLNAADPASLCGIKLNELKETLPPRLASTHLIYHGKKIVVICRRNGKSIDFKVPPDHPGLPDYVSSLKILLKREFNPLKSMRIETINSGPAGESEYALSLIKLGFAKGYKGLELRRQYGY